MTDDVVRHKEGVLCFFSPLFSTMHFARFFRIRNRYHTFQKTSSTYRYSVPEHKARSTMATKLVVGVRWRSKYSQREEVLLLSTHLHDDLVDIL